VSLYSIDANSFLASQTLRNLQSSAELLLSTFSELEVVNALQLRLFRKQDSRNQVRLALAAFDEDLRASRFQLRLLPDFVFQRARQLSLQTTARLGTRSSDLFHVAAALELGAEGFYTFDKQQKNLAESVKLRVNRY
jgi:predicted nucleic acid-binding protein